MASQSAEKLLKAVIENYFIDDEDCIRLLKSHNLRALLDKIKSRFPDCPLDSKDYTWLGNFTMTQGIPVIVLLWLRRKWAGVHTVVGGTHFLD